MPMTTMQSASGVAAELRARGWTVEEGGANGPVSVADLVQLLLYGRTHEGLEPDAEVVLEDPNTMRPWRVRGARLEGGRLVLDVWG